MFNEEELYKHTIHDSNKSTEIEGVETNAKEKKVQQVTFKENLIEGPTPSNADKEKLTAPSGVSILPETSSNSEDSMSEEEVETVSDTETSLDGYMLARDRVRRKIKPPSRFEDEDFVAYALAAADEIEIEEPKTFMEAMSSRKRKQWKNGADEEVDSLKRNHTWILIEKPENAKVIGCKWICRLKP